MNSKENFMLDQNPGYFNMKYFFLSSEKILFYNFIPLKEKVKNISFEIYNCNKNFKRKKIKLSDKKINRDNFTILRSQMINFLILLIIFRKKFS